MEAKSPQIRIQKADLKQFVCGEQEESGPVLHRASPAKVQHTTSPNQATNQTPRQQEEEEEEVFVQAKASPSSPDIRVMLFVS